MSIIDSIIGIYDKQYKPLMLIPIVLLIASLVVLGMSYANTGEFVTKGISLKGGIAITFAAPSGITFGELQSALSTELEGDVNVRALGEGGNAYFIVEASDAPESAIVAALQKQGITLTQGAYSVEQFGGSLGASFFRQTLWALVAAFVSMAIVVFITFRQVLPSFYVVLAVVCTMTMTLATTNLLGVRMSTAGIAAFLMLIGYSVDTDILLTSRVMRRNEGTVFDRVLSATKTGMTLTLTAFAATLVSYFSTDSDVIRQIMLILTIGLFYDMINTWLQNGALLRMYMEKKHRG